MAWSLLIAAALYSVGAPRLAQAQAWDYPLFQQSHVVNREFDAGIAGAGKGGTTFLFQWREGVSLLGQFSLDAGLAAARPRGLDIGFVGAQYAYQLAQPTPDLPLEILGIGGLNFAFGNGETYFRIPVGVSVGHKFTLAPGGLAVTPYLNPRLSLDVCNVCGTSDRGRSELGVGIDLGANVDLSSRFSLRAAAGFGGTGVISHKSSYGVAFAWRPNGVIPLPR